MISYLYWEKTGQWVGMRREAWCDMLGVWLPGVGGKCLGLVTGLSHDSDMWTLAPSESFWLCSWGKGDD